MASLLALCLVAIIIGAWYMAVRIIWEGGKRHPSHSVRAGEFLNEDEPDEGDSAAAANRTVVEP